MLRWEGFANERPDLAEAARELIYGSGTGSAYLATIRKNGGPRINPIGPVFVGGGLYAVLAGGPKVDDLLRDGRFALHSFPRPDNEDAFSMKGRAERITDAGTLAAVESTFWTERGYGSKPARPKPQTVVEFLIESCLLTRTTGHLDSNPTKTVWRRATR